MGHNRSRSRQSGRKKFKHPSLLKRINRNAAGIDCGSEAHYVAVPLERDPEPVRSFKTFTADLHRLADWLGACKIKTVAMESTGVYWIPIFEILEECGFEVVLVNAQHIKNVPDVCRGEAKEERALERRGEEMSLRFRISLDEGRWRSPVRDQQEPASRGFFEIRGQLLGLAVDGRLKDLA